MNKRIELLHAALILLGTAIALPIFMEWNAPVNVPVAIISLLISAGMTYVLTYPLVLIFRDPSDRNDKP